MYFIILFNGRFRNVSANHFILNCPFSVYIHSCAQALSSSADAPLLKRLPSTTFAPFASSCIFFEESPKPLPPDVAKGACAEIRY